jgi:hypothetical protein
LIFFSSDQVLADVARLRAAGYTSVGKLDLAQICTHLADSCDGYVRGFDIEGPWYMRRLLAPVVRWTVLTFNWIPTGIRLPDGFMPGSGGDADEAIARLRRELERFDGYRGECALHPFLGRMTLSQYRKLNLLHCAHHLSFLIPRELTATADIGPASPPTARTGR